MTDLPESDQARHRLDRAEQLFADARILPREERKPFIEEACRGDPELHADLASLLQHADAAEVFFGRLAEVAVPRNPTLSGAAGHYQIMDFIGVGGMGAVYRARDTRLQRDVALKFLSSHPVSAPGARERLLIEARAAAALEHANVCTVFEIGETDDGRPFIAMAFYEGETLKERLLRGPLALPEAVDTTIQIVRGLSAAHALGIVHRDVKPGNIMLTANGTVKLLDFGLAKVPDVSLTTPGVTPGTIAYMSPEQLRGAVVGARSDLWSLGVVLYEMLTGVHPFRDGNDGSLGHDPLDAGTASSLKYRPGTPGSLQQIVARLLRVRPEERYVDADGLLSDLQSLLPGATGLTVSRRSTAWRRRTLAAAGAMLVLGGAAVWLFGRPPVSVATARASAAAILGRDAPATNAKTLAVLPFTNLSADPEEDYFSDGLTEELIGVLSRVRALRVAARTSSFAFKGENRDIRDIGRALNVRAVLEGSVRKEGDRLRVSAQLVDVDDGFPIWSETYDRQLADVFAIQRDLAVRIAAALEAELTPGERQRLALRPTASPQAFALYLKGRYFWNERTSASFIRAIEYYQRAIDADPRYAAPHAGLAIVYSVQGMWGDLAPSEARTRMKAAALEAVRLDDGLAEAHAVLGAYMHLYEWDSEAAEREQLRAIELDPGYADARHFYGNFLRAAGRIEEAVTQKKTAVELDPLVPVLSSSLGITLLLAGHHDEALEHIRSALELDSTSWQTHEHLGSFYETTGRLEEALLAYRKAVELARAAPYRSTPDVARVLARLGREEEARQMLNELQAEAALSGIHSPVVATVLFALGDTDAAFDWLEKSYQERHPRLRFMNELPAFAAIGGEPQFNDLLRRVGLRP